MPDQGRSNQGKFLPKSNENRRVRSIRLTDSTWDKLGEMASSKNLTRADFLEKVLVSESLSVIPGQSTEINFSDSALSKIDKAASLRCITRNKFIVELVEDFLNSASFSQKMELSSETQMGVSKLAKLFSVDPKTIRDYKDGKRGESLMEWSKGKSPDGKAWDYDPASKLYFQID
ncbi:MAG: ribbon-helix-helix domain-containing protein [Symploca sp. SIO2G7]|nr:ribbon-helix-helix domain-containing protein [Symploca sp. SIO2G7]